MNSDKSIFMNIFYIFCEDLVKFLESPLKLSSKHSIWKSDDMTSTRNPGLPAW